MKNLFFIGVFLLSLTINGQSFSVLTYNLKYDNPKDSINGWENRKEFLISQLDYNHPDIFGTQEGLYHQLEDIKQGLKEYDFFGLGRDFGDKRGEFSAIFYNTNRIKLLKKSTFWLSEKPNIPSKGWDAALNRICTYGLFEIQKSGKQFYVFNTHFDHIGETARQKSALLILKKIKEINVTKLPVILMGDFNLEKNSVGIQSILKVFKDTHFIAKKPFGPSGTFNGFHFEKPVTRKIDFIFSANKIEVLKSGILSDSKNCKYPSDHFPIYVELKL